MHINSAYVDNLVNHPGNVEIHTVHSLHSLPCQPTTSPITPAITTICTLPTIPNLITPQRIVTLPFNLTTTLLTQENATAYIAALLEQQSMSHTILPSVGNTYICSITANSNLLALANFDYLTAAIQQSQYEHMDFQYTTVGPPHDCLFMGLSQSERIEVYT